MRRTFLVRFPSFAIFPLALLLAASLPSCLVLPGAVTVRLVNTSSFTVDPNLYAAAGSLSADELFQSTNLVTSFSEEAFATIPPGQSRDVTIRCRWAGTVGVYRPVFTGVGVGTGGQSQDSLVWHQGDQFQRGQTIVFTYSAGNKAFHVAASVE